jgi:uncharacterized protein YhbP (UPF0306 family)
MSNMVSQVADFRKLHQFLNAESVLTIATADDCGSWSAPVLYVADTFVTGADVKAVKVSLYFLSFISGIIQINNTQTIVLACGIAQLYHREQCWLCDVRFWSHRDY